MKFVAIERLNLSLSEGALLPKVAINHLLIFILIRTISVSRLIRTKNSPQSRQLAIKKPQLQSSHPALNIYHIKNKYKNNQIKSSFRSAWLDSDQTSAVRRRPRRPVFSSTLFLRPETPVLYQISWLTNQEGYGQKLGRPRRL